MAKRWAWGVSLAIALGFVAFTSLRRPNLPTVRFVDGKSARVLKVSFGTNHVFSPEPLWKKSLRVVLPQALEKPLGPFQKYEAETPYESLAIFIEPFPNRSPAKSPFVVFPDGTVSQGPYPALVVFPDGTRSSVNWFPGRPIILGNYPRGEKEIALRLSDRHDLGQVKVPNPRPAKRQSWGPRALPQTNYLTGTEVVLTKCGFIENYVFVFLDARSLCEQPAGWMQWQTTIFDPLGNYCSEIRNQRPYLPGAKSERNFRVLATGLEYISAGFVNSPTAGQFQQLAPKARATNWGVQFVALFGAGTYEISKAFDVKSRKGGLLTTNTLQPRGAGWLVKCVDPVALSISTRPVFEVRVRERIGANGGRIFAGRRTDAVARGNLSAQLFTPRLPTITTNLEVEVIVRWPPAEFFVTKSE